MSNRETSDVIDEWARESAALRAENAELRKLTAELRQRAEKAEADAAALIGRGYGDDAYILTLEEKVASAEKAAALQKSLADGFSSALMAAEAERDALKQERDEARRERDTSQRTMHLALANVAQAASERDRTRLGTVNESVQPVVDAFMGWISDAEADLAALKRRVEEVARFGHVILDAIPDLRGDTAEYVAKWTETHRHMFGVKVAAALASPPVAAQGTREDAKQPDAPGWEEQRELIDADACGHLWVEHKHRCNLKRGHPGGDPELHEYRDGAGKMLAGWVDDVNEERP